MTWDATLTTWDVAVALRCSMATVWYLIGAGLPSVVVEPGVLRFRQIDVDLVKRRAERARKDDMGACA